MAIQNRNNRSDEQIRRQNKIRQAYELHALALKDGDTVDAARWLQEAKRLEQEL